MNPGLLNSNRHYELKINSRFQIFLDQNSSQFEKNTNKYNKQTVFGIHFESKDTDLIFPKAIKPN